MRVWEEATADRSKSGNVCHNPMRQPNSASFSSSKSLAHLRRKVLEAVIVFRLYTASLEARKRLLDPRCDPTQHAFLSLLRLRLSRYIDECLTEQAPQLWRFLRREKDRLP